MWSQKPVCGLFANNVGSLAAIVGPTSRVFAANVGRQVPLFASQPPDDCGPLHLAVNDENQTAQFATLEDGRILPQSTITLIGKQPSAATLGKAPEVTTCPQPDKKYKEFDGEAVAYAAPYFYVVGSHGCGRNNQAFRLSSFLLARIRVDSQARPVDAQGHPLSAAAAGHAVDTTYRLSDALQRAPDVDDVLFEDGLVETPFARQVGLRLGAERVGVGCDRLKWAARRKPHEDKQHQ